MTKGAFPKIAAAAIAACGAGVVAALVAPALAQGLPDGQGKELVNMACLDCHDLSPITGAGFSRAEWDTVVRSMADMGANIKREDIPVVVNYLATSFPPKATK
jgi:cytochrome c5